MKKNIIILLYTFMPILPLLAQCPVTITAGGPTTFCKGGSVILTASNGLGYTWQWKKNGSNISGATAQSYSVTTGGSYTVMVTATGGCTSLSAAVPVTVTLETVYTTANGYTGIGCLNGNVNLSLVNGSGLTSFQWKLNAVNIGGATSMNYSGTQPGIYSCQVSNGTCTAITGGINVQSQVATISTSDPTIFCTGSAVLTTTLNFASTPGVTYQWKNNGIDIPGANSASYNASTGGQYTCVANNTNSGFCNAGTAPSNAIGVQAGVPPQISVAATTGANPVNLCNGQTIDLVVTDVSNGQIWPGGVVDWQRDGVSVSPFPGGNYLLGVSESGIYNALITTTCGISFAQMGLPVVSLIPGVSPYVTSNGVTSNCSLVTLYVEPGSISFTPYQWKRNGLSIAGANSFSYNAVQSGVYTCEVSNSCGTMVAEGYNQVPLNITITGAVAQITPQGSTTICSGNNVVLNATAAGASGYQWYLNSVIIGGATSATYSASVAGSYSVKVTSPGCGAVTSAPVSVTVNVSPTPVIAASGPVSFCTGDSVTLSTSYTVGATYQWKKNNVNIAGALNKNYIAKTSGNYKVEKTNASGCKGTSTVKAVTAYGVPVATATAQGPTTFCAGDSVQLKANSNSNYTYQWKRNNTNISGATSNKFEAKTAGNYKVKETNANGCTAFSSIITVSVPCRESENNWPDGTSFFATVYPNPSSSDFILKMENNFSDDFSVHFFDVNGKEIFPGIDKISDSAFRITNLNQGVYAAIIKQQSTTKILKLIKLN